MGGQFSVADGYLFVVTRWAKALNVAAGYRSSRLGAA